MITINILREKYDRIVFFGAIEKAIEKYSSYITNEDLIVDSDENKQGKYFFNIKVETPQLLKNEDINNANTAVVIIPLGVESDIYRTIRRIGYKFDVYSDDMISFSDDEKYIVTDGAYTIEKHTQLLVSLLKEYGIKNIIVSPGSCNKNFVQSVQIDDFFKLWSCIDERSAAYMACGMAQTTGEPVVISCTGATASRNYMSALTEAYYSHLPVIAITSSRDSYMIGNGIEQVTDRQHLPADIVKESIELTEIHTLEEKKYCELKINKALLATQMHGGGPVHINLVTHLKKDFSVKTLPKCKKINVVRVNEEIKFPKIKGKTAIYIKPGIRLTTETTNLINKFCEKYNSVVIGDHLSNYKGRYFIDIRPFCDRKDYEFDLLIYIGYVNSNLKINCRKSWRIAIDGKIEDSFLNQEFMFDMDIYDFVKFYVSDDKCSVHTKLDMSLYYEMKNEYNRMIEQVKDLPFSNIWVAQKLSPLIPDNSVCYFGIFSTLRNWRYFELKNTIDCYSTVGGYGIDGSISSMLGASFVNPNKLFFGFLGDLSFFYDMNSLGNRHIGNNVRICVFNNNGGNSLIHNSGLPDSKMINGYVGATGHYIGESTDIGVIKAYAESLGFIYLKAESKEEFNSQINIFLNKSDRPIIFEMKYPSQNDFEAANMIKSLS